MDESLKPRTETREKLDIKVLLADDEEAVGYVTSRMLQRLGCTVEIVKNGQELLDKLGAAKLGEFGLVITDKDMAPEMSGIQVLEKIRDDERFKHLPVIVYTGDPSTEKTIKTSGGVYLEKPFSLDQLHAAATMSLSESKE